MPVYHIYQGSVRLAANISGLDAAKSACPYGAVIYQVVDNPPGWVRPVCIRRLTGGAGGDYTFLKIQTSAKNLVKIGDLDRKALYDRLSEAYSGGYLTYPEFDTRMSAVAKARTAPALERLVRDLPKEIKAVSLSSTQAEDMSVTMKGMQATIHRQLVYGVLMTVVAVTFALVILVTA
jgi:hypothetical protein